MFHVFGQDGDSLWEGRLYMERFRTRILALATTLVTLVAVGSGVPATASPVSTNVAESPASCAAPSAEVPTVSPELQAQVNEVVAQMEARYSAPIVTKTENATIVEFTELSTGKDRKFKFAHDECASAGAEAGEIVPMYTWTSTGWNLNRTETRQLITDGTNAAILYSIGAAIGCTACAVGAAIESSWANLAATYYGRGNCIHINYWLTVREWNC